MAPKNVQPRAQQARPNPQAFVESIAEELLDAETLLEAALRLDHDDDDIWANRLLSMAAPMLANALAEVGANWDAMMSAQNMAYDAQALVKGAAALDKGRLTARALLVKKADDKIESLTDQIANTPMRIGFWPASGGLGAAETSSAACGDQSYQSERTDLAMDVGEAPVVLRQAGAVLASTIEMVECGDDGHAAAAACAALRLVELAEELMRQLVDRPSKSAAEEVSCALADCQAVLRLVVPAANGDLSARASLTLLTVAKKQLDDAIDRIPAEHTSGRQRLPA